MSSGPRLSINDMISVMLLPRNGFTASQHFEKDHPDSKQIGPVIDDCAGQLLGRHIGRGSQQIADDRELGGVDAGDAEIGDLNFVVASEP